MKTNYQMIHEVVKNAHKLLEASRKQHQKNMNDKQWQAIYTKAYKHYMSAKKSLETFKP